MTINGRPVLLDTFCKAGGATKGYQNAGFYVIGCDIEAQPHYIGDEFIQADALALLDTLVTGGSFKTDKGNEYRLSDLDAIHASPPCQHYSSATRDPDKHPDLYTTVRGKLISAGLPYIIENVIGAPYDSGVTLCGSMFNLTSDGEWLERHRNFETSWLVFQPPCNHLPIRAITVTGKCFTSEVREYEHSRQGPFLMAQKLLGIDWMNRTELPQAIPPAYTCFIGKQLIKVLGMKL